MAMFLCCRSSLCTLRGIIAKPHFCTSHRIISSSSRQRNRFNFQCLHKFHADASPSLKLRGTSDTLWLCRRMFSTRRPCWNCGRETKETELFFCECGTVQAPVPNATYYELFGIPMSFDLDVKNLSTKYKELQWKLHPDKFVLNSETEREHAASQSALVNTAYTTLQQPLSRALYLLAVHGHIVEEANTQANPELLMEVMEFNESVDAVRTAQDMAPLRTVIDNHITQLQAQLSSAFGLGDLDAAKETVLKYKYYDSIDGKIKTFYRKQML